MPTELWSIIVVVFAAIFGSFGPIFLKKGSKEFTLNITKILKNRYLILGLSIYAVSSIIFIIALKGGEVSVLYPLVSITYICVSFLSVKYLNEKMDVYKWIGIALIVLGVAFVGIGS